MATNLSTGAISILMSPQCHKIDPKPLLQVIDIDPQPLCLNRFKGVNKILLSDGSYHQTMMHHYKCSESAARSPRLRKGSVVQLINFQCYRMYHQTVIMINDLNVIHSTCDIIGDPEPFSSVIKKTHKLERVTPQEPQDSKQKSTCSRNRKRKGSVNSAGDNLANIATMMTKKQVEEDIGVCIEKLEKLGWETTHNDDDDPSKSTPDVNDESKTDLEEDVNEFDGMGNKRRKPTIEECVDKLKGLRLETN